MKKPSKHHIAEVPRSVTKVGLTIGIDLGDVWSHYCTLDSVLDRLTRGLDHVLETGAVGLSGGEQQRLAVARALLRNSPVLILDESTSALDVPTEAALLRAVRRFRPEMATVLISHRLKSLGWVDRFVVLERGRIVGEGNHPTLQRESRLYRTLLDAEPDIPSLVFTERDEVAFTRRAIR